MLPEKKRARRRLVGAIALALAAAVGLPMLLDSEPRPLAGDIAINIPSKEKAPALPLPSNPVPADSVDEDEEVIAAPPLGEPAATEPAATEPAFTEPAPAPRAATATPPAKTLPSAPFMTDDELPRTERKPVERKPEPKPEPKPERKLAEKPVEKPPEKPVPKKPEVKPDTTHPKASDAARALALLEGKSPAKPVEKAEPPSKQPEAAQRYVVQVAALATQEKVAELQSSLRAAGVSSYTQKSGSLIRVRIGPFASREEAEKARARFGGNLVAE